jgi:large subunit ribosomal protein L7Ae
VGEQILFQRLKVPPSVHQFSKTLDKNQASELFKLLTKYSPETSEAKHQRLQQLAAAKAAGQDATPSKPGPVLKYGLKHVTYLVEQQKARLVVIAHDVNPIELVLWLPALCRKMNVPFCIVKSKSRLGALVHKKNAAVVALTEVNKEDENKLSTLADNFKAQYSVAERKWGGGIMGLKTQAKLEKRRQLMEAELAKRAQQY